MPLLKNWIGNHIKSSKDPEASDAIIEQKPPKLQRNNRTLSTQGVANLIGGNAKNSGKSTRTAALWRAYAGSVEDLNSKPQLVSSTSAEDFDSEVRATASRPHNKYVAIASSSGNSDGALVSRYGLKINTAAAASRVGVGSSEVDPSQQNPDFASGSVNIRHVKTNSRHSASSYVTSNSQISSVDGVGEDPNELLTPDTPQSEHAEGSSRPSTPHPHARLAMNGTCVSFNDYASNRASLLPPAKFKGKGKKKLPDIRDIDWSSIEEDEAMNIAQAYGSTCAKTKQAREDLSDRDGGHDMGMQKLVGRWLNNQDFSDQYEGYLAIEEIERQKRELREQWKRLEEDIAARHLELERQRAEAIAQYEAEAEAARIAEERARWKECAVCGDEKDPLEFPSAAATSSCKHEPLTCKECMVSWMESEFDTKGCDGIRCPECPQTLEYTNVQECASPQTFAAYDKMATRNALGGLEEFAWCLKPECGSGQLNIDNNCFMHCVSCGYQQCLRHKVPWHNGETCEQYEYRESGQKARDEEKKTEEMLDSMSKKCPNSKCGW